MTEKRPVPPGTWRLLLPATLVWVASAALVGLPGWAPWVALGCGFVGCATTFGCLWLRVRKILRDRRTSAVDCARLNPFAGSILIACAVLTLVCVRIDDAQFSRDAEELVEAAQSAATLTVEGTLASFPETSTTPFGERAWGRAHLGTSRGEVPVLLWLPEAAPKNWAPGTTVMIRGSPERLEAVSNAAYAVKVYEIEELPQSSLESVSGVLAAQLRWGLHERAAGIEGAELVPGFAVGDTSLVPERLDEQMRETSLTHLTAVSGANCALITSAVIFCMRRCGVPRRPRIIWAGIALAGFVIVVGPDASVQRAAVMATVILASGFGGKRAVALPALGVAMLVLLISDPWQSVQPGFTLSVAATGGILLGVPHLDRWIRRLLPIPAVVRLPIAVSIAAQSACGPLLLLLAPDLPAVGVLANVLAAPAAPIGTGLGVVALVLLPVSDSSGGSAVWVASLATRWVAATAEVTSTLPFARWHWPQGWGGAVLFAVCELLLLLTWAVATGRISVRGAVAARRAPWQQPQASPRLIRSLAALCGSLAAAIIVATSLITPLTQRLGVPTDWAVVMCDVGQGDALLVRDPHLPQQVMLVDTGDDPALLQDCLLRFNVERISLAVLSHDDADHVGALGHIIERVDSALIAPNTQASEGPRHVVQQLEAARVPYGIGEAGLRGFISESRHPRDESAIEMPPTDGKGVWWQVLAPAVGAQPSDTNAASLVVRVELPEMSLMLLGDTGETEQRALLHSGEIAQIDIIKVAHHGSRDQSVDFYRELQASVGLVSVGESNGYGHPASDTLRMLSSSNTQALRSDELGTVALSVDETGEVEVWAEESTS